MNGNDGGADKYHGRGYVTTREKSMETFDSMPREIRDIINYADNKYAPGSVSRSYYTQPELLRIKTATTDAKIAEKMRKEGLVA